MSAFPITGTNALRDSRNNLRLQVRELQSSVARLSAWVEALELDRINLVGAGKPFANDAAFDAAFSSLASTLLTQISSETNPASTASLLYRIKTHLQIQGKYTIFTVSSQAAMLALPAEINNIAVRSDLSFQAFRLIGLPATTLANWASI